MGDNKEEQIDTKKVQLEEKPIESKQEETSKKRERVETENVKDNANTTTTTTKEVKNDSKTDDVEPETKKLKTEPLKEDEESKEESKEEEPTQQTKPKFVFGAATSFGSGFKVSQPNNNDKAIENDVKEISTSKPFAFGSKFSFGSGFGILKEKKDDKETKTDDSKKSDSETKETSTESSAVKKTVEEPKQEIKLHKQDVKSGEEAESCLFQANMKLYQLHSIKEGWKERGVGALKLNKNDQTGKSRMVMRSRGVLTVILNLPLIKGFSIKKGFPGSLQSEKFLRIIALDDAEKPVTYALKSGNPDLINELYDKIKELI
ncbi:ran-specific GTPase-activating protein 2 [Monosporozyma unispora]